MKYRSKLIAVACACSFICAGKAHSSSIPPALWKSLDIATADGQRIHIDTSDNGRLSDAFIEKMTCKVQLEKEYLDIDAAPTLESTALLNDVDDDDEGVLQILSVDLVFIESEDGSLQVPGRVLSYIRGCNFYKREVHKEINHVEKLIVSD